MGVDLRWLGNNEKKAGVMMSEQRSIAAQVAGELAVYWTDDEAEIPIICRKRMPIHRQNWGKSSLDGKVEAFDESGQLLVMRKHGRIVGGVRLNIGMSGTTMTLPCEQNSFKLDQALPKLYRPGLIRAQMSRFFTDTHRINSDEVTEIWRACLQKAEDWHVEQLIFLTRRAMGQQNQGRCAELGWDVTIHDDFVFQDKLRSGSTPTVLCCATPRWISSRRSLQDQWVARDNGNTAN